MTAAPSLPDQSMAGQRKTAGRRLGSAEICRRPRNATLTRQTILNAANARFLDASYDQVGLRDIAADARVDPALISRYFGSKEDLFVAVIEQLGDCSELVSGSRRDFGERAARQILFTDSGDSRLTWLRMMTHATSSPRAANILRRTSEERFFQPLAAWIGGDRAEPKAHMIASLLMGLVITRQATDRFGPRSQQTDGLFDLLAVELQNILDQ